MPVPSAVINVVISGSTTFYRDALFQHLGSYHEEVISPGSRDLFLLSRTTCRITLHQVQFRFLWRFFLTISHLSGNAAESSAPLRRTSSRAFLAASRARAAPRAFVMIFWLGLGSPLTNRPTAQPVLLEQRASLHRNQLFFCLELNFGSGTLHETSHEPFSHIVP